MGDVLEKNQHFIEWAIGQPAKMVKQKAISSGETTFMIYMYF